MDVFDLYAKIGLDTSEYDRGLASAGAKLQGLGGSIERGFGNLVKGATAAFAGATAAAGAFTAAAVQTGLSFDASMSNVKAISGATEEEFEKLTAKAEEMGAKTKYTATEMADAMGYMAMAGWKTEDMLAGLEGITNLATASGSDLATTSDIVTDALTAFGLSAQDASHFADVLATTSTNANTNVQLMGETFKYVAPVAGSLGYTIEDVSLAIGLMANSGIKASTAGTSLRGLFTRLAKQPKEAAAAMDALGISMEDGEGNMLSFRDLLKNIRDGFNNDLKVPAEEATAMFAELDEKLESGELTQKQYDKEVENLTKRVYGATGALKAQYGAMLAGTNGMSGLLALVNSSDEDFDKLADAIDNCNGSTADMAKIMGDNLQGNLARLKSAFEALQIAISRKVTPAVSDFVKLGAKELSGFADAFKDGGVSGLVDAIAKALTVDLPKEIKNKLAKGKHDILFNLFSTASAGFNNFVEGFGKAFSALSSKLSEFTKSQKFMDFLTRLREITDKMTADRIATLLTGIGEGILKIAEAVIDFVNSENVIKFFDAIGAWIDKKGVDGIADTIQGIADALLKLWAASKVVGAITAIGNGLLFLGGAARDLKSLGEALQGLKTLDIAAKFAPLGGAITDFIAGGINVAKFGDVIGSIAGAPSVAAAAGAIGTTVASGIVAAFVGADIGKAIGAAIFPDDKQLYESYAGIEGTLRLIADSIKGIFEKDDTGKTGVGNMFDLSSAKATLEHELGFTQDNAYAKAIEYMNQNLEFTHEMMTVLRQDFGLTEEQVHNLNLVNGQIRQINEGQRDGFNEAAQAILAGKEAIQQATQETDALKESSGQTSANLEAMANLNPMERFSAAMAEADEQALTTNETLNELFDEEKYAKFGEEINEVMGEKFSLGLATISEAFGLWGEDVKTTWSTLFEELMAGYDTWSETLNGKITEWLAALSENLTGLQTDITTLCDDIKVNVETLMTWLQENVKVPHFNLEGAFDLENNSVPEVKVDWYAKAMDNAMILDSPTIFGAANGRLLGGGEAGSEVVSGAGTLMNMIRGAVNGAGRDVTVVLEVDKQQLGRVVYRLNNEETQRVGVRLANV